MATNDRAVHHEPPGLHAESVHGVSSICLLEQRRLTMGYTSLTSLNSDKVYLADELQTSHVRKIRAVWQVESEPPDSTQRASRGGDTKHIVVRSTGATKCAVRSATAKEQGADSRSAVLHGTDGVRATAAVPISHDCGAERGLAKKTRENKQCANEKGEAPLPGAPYDYPRLLPHLRVFLAVVLAAWWAGMARGPSHRPRRPPGMAVVWMAMLVGGLGERMFVGATAKGVLTDVEFKEATWEWVQSNCPSVPADCASAEGKWGNIGDWDVTGVKDFAYAFSKHRDVTGGSFQSNGNAQAATFVSTDLSKWKTNAVTTLEGAFWGASSMNQGISNFDVSKVVSLKSTFESANSFNSVLNWDVSKVATLEQTFKSAGSLLSGGLSKWDTGAVTTLKKTFNYAGLIDVDFGTWITANVKNM